MEYVMFVAFIIFCQLAPWQVGFLSDGLECVALACYEIIVFVVDADGMESLSGHHGVVTCATLSHKLVIVTCVVVLVELIEFDDVNELLSVGGIGGIATRFQSPSPSPVVGQVEPEELGIPLVACEEAAVILIALFGIVVGTETFTDVVVVLVHRASRPSMAFDAKMVVALCGEWTESSAAFKGTLG